MSACCMCTTRRPDVPYPPKPLTEDKAVSLLDPQISAKIGTLQAAG
jgi:hypothetical protein